MSAHTPGPWHLDRSTLISAYVMAENGRHVVSLPVGAGWWHSPKSEWDNSQDGADARLIAAAPDLLAALEAILAADNAPLVLSDSHSVALLDGARAAIVKATGAA
jgi:hypothetical protein